MNRGGLLQAVHGCGRGVRLATAGVTVWLLVSLLVSLQPCCALFTALFGQHASESAVVLQGVDHGDHSTGQISQKDKNDCDDGASASTDLAKALPAVPGKVPSTHDMAAFVALSLPVFAAVPRLVLPSAYHSSPPRFRLYLRFLHLLI